MFDNSDMIGDYKGTVKNRVITALLQSYLDNLDYDGMKSILREAELLELKDMRDVDQEGTIDFFSFKKLIAAQNCLLYDSNDLLYEIGRKFAFYLFPYGKNFDEIIEEINELIVTDWNVSIVDQTGDSVSIKVKKCVFCSEIGVPCYLFKGFLVYSLEKTLPNDFQVIPLKIKEDVFDPNHNTFHLTLQIEKIFKI
jgi:predicted hydrocarbon binding protein